MDIFSDLCTRSCFSPAVSRLRLASSILRSATFESQRAKHCIFSIELKKGGAVKSSGSNIIRRKKEIGDRLPIYGRTFSLLGVAAIVVILYI